MNNLQALDGLSNARSLQKQMAAQFSLKEILFKYLSYLPFILLVFSISVGVGYVYIRYTEPVYKANVQILVKADDTKQSDPSDLIQRALRETKVLNTENEITKLRSLILLKEVVEAGKFNVKVRNIGRFRSTTLFYDSPLIFEVVSVKDSASSYELRFTKFTDQYAYLDLKTMSGVSLPEQIPYDQVIEYNGLRFIIKKVNQFKSFNEPIAFLYEPSLQTARRIAGSMNVGAVGKTSILSVDLKDDNPNRAKEILDKLVEVFKQQDVEMKRISSLNTIAFIDERLKEVATEVDEAEGQIMQLRKQTPFGDVAATTDMVKDKYTLTESERDKVAVQYEIIKILEEYFSKESPAGRTVPNDLGIDNIFLSGALKDYNDLQLRYERDRAQIPNSPESKILADYRLRLKELRYNILEMIASVKKEVKRRLDNVEGKIIKYETMLGELPSIDKQIKNIQTQVTIKKELYLYLLKRKEEVAITSATFISNYEAIDAASASHTPVEPRVDNIRNFSMLIGIIIPVLIIYLLDLFNDKVTLRDQIIKKLDIPIAGEVSHVANPSKFVFNQSRSLVAEQFRILRTNLSFLFKGSENNKVILISSTISGEGKSFVSSNLAAAISVMDKKVALLLFDLRKANVAPVVDVLLQGRATRGITNYLIGQTESFEDLCVIDPEYPNLSIFPSGPIPPNPAELLLSPKMKDLFEYIRKTYDYVIVDSAPAGLVSDAFILQQYTDHTLYIIRQQFTLLKQLEFINEIAIGEKLTNMSIVVNDVTMGGRYGYYGYNYGYGYAYSYNYGYGYKQKSNGGGYYADIDMDIKRPWWVTFFKFISRWKKK